jgi:CHAD domain-containing protein
MNLATQELYASIVIALARLRQPRLSDQSVHEARRSLKKARAALRLLRPGLEPAAYRAENALLRDAGRSLAVLRDPKVLLDVLAALKQRDTAARHATALRRVTGALQSEEKRLARDGAVVEAALATCVRLLEQSLARAERPDFLEIGGKPLAKGLRRIYRKGRKALAQAHASRTPEALHEWRKQSKYLLNAMAMLPGKPKGRLKKTVRRAQELADRLGDVHDLDLLATRARGHAKDRRSLQALIGKRRAKLEKEALAVGRKLYKRKAKRFLKRVPISSS